MRLDQPNQSQSIFKRLATTSGRAPHAITLDANGGSFAGSDSVTVYRTEGSTLNGGDLDIYRFVLKQSILWYLLRELDCGV